MLVKMTYVCYPNATAPTNEHKYMHEIMSMLLETYVSNGIYERMRYIHVVKYQLSKYVIAYDN